MSINTPLITLSLIGLLGLVGIICPSTSSADCRLLDAAGATPDWVAQHKACPDSPLLAYNAAVARLNQGNASAARRLVDRYAPKFPQFQPLADLERLFSQPYALAADLAQAHLQQWRQDYRLPRFQQQPPEKPAVPPLPELVKGEFETTPQFKQRVAEARQARKRKIARLERNYSQAVADFNAAVEAHNRAMERALAERKRQTATKRQQLLNQALAQVLGEPRLSELQYNADAQFFHARLTSSHGNFDQHVKIAMPLAVAREFKTNTEAITPQIEFRLSPDGQLQVAAIRASFRGQTHLAELTAESGLTERVAVQLSDTASPNFEQISTLDTSEVDLASGPEDDAYFDQAIDLEADPTLARLKQKQAELTRKKKEAQRRQALERERQQLQDQIEQQERELQALETGTAGHATTDWAFERARQQPANALAVIIGNRDYGSGVPPVTYAHNDARAMRAFFRDTLGLAEDDILFETDASKGVMEGLFRSTLPNRVEPGRTDVFVYYSGHGMIAERQAILLPADARANTAAVTGYPRPTLLAQLGELDARSVTVMLDACYSGTAKSGEALIAGKPVFRSPQAASVPANTTLLNATRANQIAWMAPEHGHSLFTYHLLKGLQGQADRDTDRRIETAELGDYLQEHVNRAARRLHEQPQSPQVLGTGRVLVAY